MPAGSGGRVAWRYPGNPPQEARAAKTLLYAPLEAITAAAGPIDESEVVGYMPIRFADKFGYYIDERGGLNGVNGPLDLRVKKSRGCQGSGSAERWRRRQQAPPQAQWSTERRRQQEYGEGTGQGKRASLDNRGGGQPAHGGASAWGAYKPAYGGGKPATAGSTAAAPAAGGGGAGGKLADGGKGAGQPAHGGQDWSTHDCRNKWRQEEEAAAAAHAAGQGVPHYEINTPAASAAGSGPSAAASSWDWHQPPQHPPPPPSAAYTNWADWPRFAAAERWADRASESDWGGGPL